MKTQSKKLASVKGLGDIETPENNPVLLHFLSPLELAAYKHQFQPFVYNLDGLTLEIELHVCKELGSSGKVGGGKKSKHKYWRA